MLATMGHRARSRRGPGAKQDLSGMLSTSFPDLQVISTKVCRSAHCWIPDEGRPEADWTDAVSFPDWKKLVSKAG